MSTKPSDFILISKTGKDLIKLDFSILRKAVLTLRSINHPLRKKIISLLEKNEHMTVTDLFVHLRVEQSVASQHLSILRKANVVNSEREGKFIYYSLNRSRLSEISKLVEDLA